MATRPTIFKWRQTELALILCAVRWYLRYSLSLRDVEELLEEGGLEADHTTIWRWVQRYGPELEQRQRRHLLTLWAGQSANLSTCTDLAPFCNSPTSRTSGRHAKADAPPLSARRKSD